MMRRASLFCIWFTIFVLMFCVFFGNRYKGVALKLFEKPTEWMQSMSDGADAFFDRRHLIRENRTLKERLTKVNNSYEYEYIKKENEELKKALAFSEKNEKKCVAARVVKLDADGKFCITLDRGKNHGIEVGDAVVFGDALAGKVSEVYPEFCVFLPITAQGCTTGVMNENSDAGLVGGSALLVGKNMCTLSFFGEVQASVGDRIFTSGFSDVYPAGLLVGKIHSTGKNITVKTETDFFKARIFSVILSR